MANTSHTPTTKPDCSVELIQSELSQADLNDLCDATDASIEDGGGFGWLKLPSREILEKYWQGVVAMPQRLLFVARLDCVICGSAQIIIPPRNNEAQAFSVQLTSHFVAPWAREHGLAKMLLHVVEKTAKEHDFDIINLDVRETQKAAISLYESQGYKVFGSHPHYAKVDEKTIRGVYYYKVLS